MVEFLVSGAAKGLSINYVQNRGVGLKKRDTCVERGMEGSRQIDVNNMIFTINFVNEKINFHKSQPYKIYLVCREGVQSFGIISLGGH